MNPEPDSSADIRPVVYSNTVTGYSCSSSVFGNFAWNDDVWMEILLCMPAKSLIRFKAVCKFWLSLISSLHFSQLHTLRHPKPQPSLLLQTTTSNYYFHPIIPSEKLVPYHFPLTRPKVLNSCNGLFLLQSDHPDKDYYIYNPTTRQSRKITLPTNKDSFPIVLGVNLAFDPSKSPHYKIIYVKATSSNASCCKIEVYESETRDWKVRIGSFSASIQVNFSNGVHWNNVIHWENYPHSHLYFDINNNVLGNLPYVQIPWPDSGARGACHCQLQESNGHLHHFVLISHHGDKSVAVFELREDYSLWLLKYHDRFGRLPGRFRILSFDRGDSEQTSTIVYHIPGEITAYTFLDKSFKELVDLKNEPFYNRDAVQFEPRNVHQFGETLAPLKSSRQKTTGQFLYSSPEQWQPKPFDTPLLMF